MRRRTIFRNKLLPYLLLIPQLAVTIIFFFYPAAQALYQSMLFEDPFGLRTQFVWFENFQTVLSSPLYLEAARVTVVFSVAVTLGAMAPALLLAVMADQVLRGAAGYRTLIVWPYAIAPAVAAVLMLFIFHPTIGQVGQGLRALGVPWDYRIHGGQALFLVIFVSAWKQVSYNFLFFLAGLQSIPKTIVEAAAIDGASPARRFWTVVFPLLSPTTYFLTLVAVIGTFKAFNHIWVLRSGAALGTTDTASIIIFNEFNRNTRYGYASALALVLMGFILVLTLINNRIAEEKVFYG